jgi:hypothetical protein
MAARRWRVVEGLTSAMGENATLREASAGVALFIGEGERGGGPGPARRRKLADGLPEQLDCGTHRVPLPLVTNQWHLVGF